MRVLIVDDTGGVRRRLALLVAAVPGVSLVQQAVDGLEALDALSADETDVVVLDLLMPRLGGFGVLEALERRDGRPVVIVLTNHAEYRDQALRRGADYFVDKSTELARLTEILADLAAGPPVVVP